MLAQIGKDRTGLLAAMVLTCCGASVDEIVTDYARYAPSLASSAWQEQLQQSAILISSGWTCKL